MRLIRDLKTISKFTTTGTAYGLFGSLGYSCAYRAYYLDPKDIIGYADVEGMIVMYSTFAGMSAGLVFGASKALLDEIIDACHHYQNKNPQACIRRP